MITKMVTKVGNVCKPDSYDEVFQLARILHDNGFVFVSLENIANKPSKQIIDFLAGVAYAMDGNLFIKNDLFLFLANQPDSDKVYTALLEEIAARVSTK